MKIFRSFVCNDIQIKCHYPGCYNPATDMMTSNNPTLFLCPEHCATEIYIATTNNLPFGDDIAAKITVSVPQKETEQE